MAKKRKPTQKLSKKAWLMTGLVMVVIFVGAVYAGFRSVKQTADYIEVPEWGVRWPATVDRTFELQPDGYPPSELRGLTSEVAAWGLMIVGGQAKNTACEDMNYSMAMVYRHREPRPTVELTGGPLNSSFEVQVGDWWYSTDGGQGAAFICYERAEDEAAYELFKKKFVEDFQKIEAIK